MRPLGRTVKSSVVLELQRTVADETSKAGQEEVGSRGALSAEDFVSYLGPPESRQPFSRKITLAVLDTTAVLKRAEMEEDGPTICHAHLELCPCSLHRPIFY